MDGDGYYHELHSMGVDVRCLFVVLFWGVVSLGVIEADDILSEHEYRVLESGGRDSLELVISRLRLLTHLRGKEAVRPFVPALVQRVQVLQGVVDSIRQAEQELENYMLDLLVKIGDERARSVLIEGLVIASEGVASGLLNLGAVPSVIDSLGSERIGMAWGAALALIEIHKRRPGLLQTQEIGQIVEHLLRRVQQGSGGKMAFIKALGVFGDTSILPILMEVAQQDTFLGPRQTYVNRVCAEQVIAEFLRRAVK